MNYPKWANVFLPGTICLSLLVPSNRGGFGSASVLVREVPGLAGVGASSRLCTATEC